MTRREIEEVVTEVEVLCRLAAQGVRSYMPIGLGDDYKDGSAALEHALAHVPREFRRWVRKAQKEHRWAAK